MLIVDIGLPDGSGLDLISTCAKVIPRIDVILGTSGDSILQEAVLACGANGFIPKPISSLAAFQSAILFHLPTNRQPPGPRLVTNESVNPDLIAYQDDLTHMAAVIGSGDARESLGYVTHISAGHRTIGQRQRSGQCSQCRGPQIPTGHLDRGGFNRTWRDGKLTVGYKPPALAHDARIATHL